MLEVETKSASLDTLAVTIQALHVNGKQMTLAVFRQLPVVELYLGGGVDPSLRLWGVVRYQIKDEGALWAVADRDGRLYRCDVDRTGESSARVSTRLTWLRAELESFNVYVAYRKKWRDWEAAGGWKADPSGKSQPSYPSSVRVHKSDWDNDPDRVHGEKAWEIADDEARLQQTLGREASRAVVASLPQLFIAV